MAAAPGHTIFNIARIPKTTFKKWHDPVIFFACAGDWGVMLVNMNAFQGGESDGPPPFA